jgi:hypothetical protein
VSYENSSAEHWIESRPAVPGLLLKGPDSRHASQHASPCINRQTSWSKTPNSLLPVDSTRVITLACTLLSERGTAPNCHAQNKDSAAMNQSDRALISYDNHTSTTAWTDIANAALAFSSQANALCWFCSDEQTNMPADRPQNWSDGQEAVRNTVLGGPVHV